MKVKMMIQKINISFNNKSNKEENYDEQNKSMSPNEDTNKNKLESGEENMKDLNKPNDINMNNQDEENIKMNDGDNKIIENNENKVVSIEKNINEEKYNNNDNSNNRDENKLDDMKNILDEDGGENDSKLCKINPTLAKQYGEQALGARKDVNRYRTLSSKINDISSKLNAAYKNHQLTSQMASMVNKLSSINLNAVGAVETLDKFEKMFDNIDVQTKVMDDVLDNIGRYC